MPTQTLGKVKLTPRGAYDPAATYVPLDIVSYGGGSYCVLKNVTGVTPTGDDVNFQLLAESGADGKSPQISASKTWLVWDADAGEYVDTGVSAAGETPEVDDTLTQPGQAADAAVVGDRLSALSEEIANLQTSGLTTAQINALDGMFKVCAFTKDNVSAEYTEFKTAFGIADSGGGDEEPDEPVVVTYTITNTLTNVSNSNSDASVNENASYIATLTADEGYELDSVTVTMGGDDITGSVYAYGGIYISSITGNIVITATAVEKAVEDDHEAYNWTSGEAYVIDEWTDGYGLTYDTSASTTVETLTESSRYCYSEYLPCAGASAFVASSDLYFDYSMDHVYDSDKAYMGYVAKHKADNTPFGGVTYMGLPMGAKYLRLTTQTSKKATSTVTPYKFDELTANTIPEDGKIYAVTPTAGVELNATTGVATESGSCCTSDFMACYGFKTFHFAEAMRKCVCFYDSDKKFISGLAYSSIDTGAIPEGVAYMRHTCTTSRNTLIVLSKEETA